MIRTHKLWNHPVPHPFAVTEPCKLEVIGVTDRVHKHCRRTTADCFSPLYPLKFDMDDSQAHQRMDDVETWHSVLEGSILEASHQRYFLNMSHRSRVDE